MSSAINLPNRYNEIIHTHLSDFCIFASRRNGSAFVFLVEDEWNTVVKALSTPSSKPCVNKQKQKLSQRTGITATIHSHPLFNTTVSGHYVKVHRGAKVQNPVRPDMTSCVVLCVPDTWKLKTWNLNPKSDDMDLDPCTKKVQNKTDESTHLKVQSIESKAMETDDLCGATGDFYTNERRGPQGDPDPNVNTHKTSSSMEVIEQKMSEPYRPMLQIQECVSQIFADDIVDDKQIQAMILTEEECVKKQNKWNQDGCIELSGDCIDTFTTSGAIDDTWNEGNVVSKLTHFYDY
eukprot:812081_1